MTTEEKNYMDCLHKYGNEISRVSNKLRTETPVMLLGYYRIYDDGNLCDLIPLEGLEWVGNFVEKYLKEDHSTLSEKLKTGANYWRNCKNENLKKQEEDARLNFDIDARFDLVYRDQKNLCFHNYSFCSSRKNADKAHAFYGNHLSKLFKFTSLFEDKTAGLLISSAQNNKILVPKLNIKSLEGVCKKRDLPMEIEREKMEFSPSDKEWIVMLLYAHGLQKEIVARMLNKSLPTIVTQIESIKNKTGLMNRFEMMMYLKDRGEDKNINFFVPYIPENAA